ncbi:MAG: DUF5615 family PIN-like protein, partial [Ktedonobacterales bacterium]
DAREVRRTPRNRGHEVEHVLDLGLKAQPDALIFLVAQERTAALYSFNRAHFELLVSAWTTWAHGAHAGLILPYKGQPTSDDAVRSLATLLERISTLENRVVYI